MLNKIESGSLYIDTVSHLLLAIREKESSKHFCIGFPFQTRVLDYEAGLWLNEILSNLRKGFQGSIHPGCIPTDNGQLETRGAEGSFLL